MIDPHFASGQQATRSAVAVLRRRYLAQIAGKRAEGRGQSGTTPRELRATAETAEAFNRKVALRFI